MRAHSQQSVKMTSNSRHRHIVRVSRFAQQAAAHIEQETITMDGSKTHTFSAKVYRCRLDYRNKERRERCFDVAEQLLLHVPRKVCVSLSSPVHAHCVLYYAFSSLHGRPQSKAKTCLLTATASSKIKKIKSTADGHIVCVRLVSRSRCMAALLRRKTTTMDVTRISSTVL